MLYPAMQALMTTPNPKSYSIFDVALVQPLYPTPSSRTDTPPLRVIFRRETRRMVDVPALKFLAIVTSRNYPLQPGATRGKMTIAAHTAATFGLSSFDLTR